MRYRAFISYSHKDERWGTRLHKRLETYRFPKKLIGKETPKGLVPDIMKPVFRDREELSAGANLGDEIEKRLRESENLVVLCSPNAARSKWVNEEILYFKRHNDAGRIYALIIDGEPFSGGDDECFPEALRYELDADGELSTRQAEPLAADAREEGDGPRIAQLKLLAGMAGLGLDDLLRRDLQRARRRVTLITVSALSAMLVMGSLTWAAIDARGEAEARKNDAEGLIEFMLTDLRDKLEPVGRLDALDAVGQKASDYYSQYNPERSAGDRSGRYARVLHFLGSVQDKLGKDEDALKHFSDAFDVTQNSLESDPENPQRNFEHAQSAYWVGFGMWQRGQHAEALPYFETYLEIAEKLQLLEPDKPRSLQEVSYANEMIGIMTYFIGNIPESKAYFETAVAGYRENLQKSPSDIQYNKDYINGLRWIVVPMEQLGETSEALEVNEEACRLNSKLLSEHPDDHLIIHDAYNCENDLLVSALSRGDLKRANELADSVHEKLEILLRRDSSNSENLIYLVYNILDRAKLALFRSDTDAAESLIREAKRLCQSPKLTDYSSVYLEHYLPREIHTLSFARNILEGDFEGARNHLNALGKVIDGFGATENFELEEKRSYIRYKLHKLLLNYNRDEHENLIRYISSLPDESLTITLRIELAIISQQNGIKTQLLESHGHLLIAPQKQSLFLKLLEAAR